MFTRMRMTNFKSWRDSGEVQLAPLTAFFGANGSGKSSLLQMLLLLKQTTESIDRDLVLKTGSDRGGYVTLGTTAEIAFCGAQEMTFEVDWLLDDILRLPIPDPNRKLEVSKLHFETHIHVDPQRAYVKRFAYRSGDEFFAALERASDGRHSIRVNRVNSDGLGVETSRPEKCYGFPRDLLRSYRGADHLRDVVLKFEQQFHKLYYLGLQREAPQRRYFWEGERPINVGSKGERAVHALLVSKRDKRPAYPRERRDHNNLLEICIVGWLREMGLAYDLELRPRTDHSDQYELRLRRQADRPFVSIADIGSGVAQILPVLVLCYYAPPGSTIIFEQPELHLHPSVQSSLADVFIDVVKRRDIQIILESHSEHLLRRLQLRMAEQKISGEDASLYFCNLQQGVSALQRLETNIFGEILNWPSNFFGDVAGDMVKLIDVVLDKTSDATKS